MSRAITIAWALLVVMGWTGADASEVHGVVRMPASCSTTMSPAVARLDPVGHDVPSRPAGAAVIGQRAMSFEPRVIAVAKGQVIRFGNADETFHNVHVQGPGLNWNQGVAPGATIELAPESPGVLKVTCDIHSHMRAFIVVGGSPWATACDARGRFDFADVPPGAYRLSIWHEMGAPLSLRVEVGEAPLDVGTIDAPEGFNAATASDRDLICETGCEPWPLVIDRIAVTLSEGLATATRPGASPEQASSFAGEARHRDFEASGMRTAVRLHLGQDRSWEIEDCFHDASAAADGLAAGHGDVAAVLSSTRRALLALQKASDELNKLGVTERSRIFAKTSPAFWAEDSGQDPALEPPPASALEATAEVLLQATPLTLLMALLLAQFIAASGAQAKDPGDQSPPHLAWILAVCLGFAAWTFAASGPHHRFWAEGGLRGLTTMALAIVVFILGYFRLQGIEPTRRLRILDGRAHRQPGLATLAVALSLVTIGILAANDWGKWSAKASALAFLGFAAGAMILVGLGFALTRAASTGTVRARRWGSLAILGLSVALAGDSVRQFQNAGALRTTTLENLVPGPIAALPGVNVQILLIQSVLLAAGLCALLLSERGGTERPRSLAE